MEGGKPKVIENSEGRAPRRRSSPTPTTARSWSARRPSARRSPTPKNTLLFAVKRLIGRRWEKAEVQKDIDLMPYGIVKADNGDAWVEVRGKKIAPPQVSADADEDEEDRRGLPR